MTQMRLAWLVLIAGCIVLGLNLGIRQSLGLFLPDMMAATGWSASTFGLALAVQNLVWGIASPVGGMLADRFGSAKTIIGGTALYVAGLWLMGHAETVLQLHLGAGILIGLGVGATTFPIVLGAIGRSFPPEKRSLALGIASAGGSVGQFVMAPISSGLNGAFGYASALLIIAAMAMLMVPLSAALRGRSEGSHDDEGPQTLILALREAGGHRSYWLLNMGFFVCGFHVAFIAVHLPAFVQSCGLPNSVAANGLALVGLFNVFGTLTAGWFGGRFPKRWGLSMIYFLRALLIIVFVLGPKTEFTILLFSAIMGMLWLSTVPLTSGIVGAVFGPRYVASLFGFVMLSHQIGAFFGAWMGGWVFDRTGSFDLVWYTAAALGLMAAIVHMPINESPLRALKASSGV